MKNIKILSAGLLAVMVVMTGQALADTMTVNTDSSWKYSKIEITGWNTPGIDDSTWSNAVEIGNNGISPWSNVYLGTTAKWIWTSDSFNDDIAYFRKEINIDGIPTSAWVNITVDNQYDLYVNGVWRARDLNWWTVERYPVNLNPGKNIIAVKGVDTGNPAALLADVKINYIPTTPPPPLLPELPTIALMGFGILGLIFMVNRKW